MLKENDFKDLLIECLSNDTTIVKLCDIGNYRQVIIFDRKYNELTHEQAHSYEAIFWKKFYDTFINNIEVYCYVLIKHPGLASALLSIDDKIKNADYFSYVAKMQEESVEDILSFDKWKEANKKDNSTYTIYQLSENADQKKLLFRPYCKVLNENHGVNYLDYEMIYSGSLDNMTLDDIYTKFNINHPEDFKGHSLSVSDVVVISKNHDVEKAYYVDIYGFAEVPEFLLYKKIVNKILDKAINYVANKAIDLNETIASIGNNEMTERSRLRLSGMQDLLNHLEENLWR